MSSKNQYLIGHLKNFKWYKSTFDQTLFLSLAKKKGDDNSRVQWSMMYLSRQCASFFILAKKGVCVL